MNGPKVVCSGCGEVEVGIFSPVCADCQQVAGLAIQPAPLRGWGTRFSHGGARDWYVGQDGVQRWADNDEPA